VYAHIEVCLLRETLLEGRGQLLPGDRRRRYVLRLQVLPGTPAYRVNKPVHPLNNTVSLHDAQPIAVSYSASSYLKALSSTGAHSFPVRPIGKEEFFRPLFKHIIEVISSVPLTSNLDKAIILGRKVRPCRYQIDTLERLP
jgi:hypothetical protein